MELHGELKQEFSGIRCAELALAIKPSYINLLTKSFCVYVFECISFPLKETTHLYMLTHAVHTVELDMIRFPNRNSGGY